MPKEKKIRPPSTSDVNLAASTKCGRNRSSGARDYIGSGKLRDKIALITGGDSGIGRAVAVLLRRKVRTFRRLFQRAQGCPENEAAGRSCRAANAC
jgi:hypothetical protein